MKITPEEIWSDLLKIREKAPLIHNITNYVVMNITANALLALGASPVMAHAENEVKEMVSLAQALVINIGTLSNHWISSMKKALYKAKDLGVPVVIDPVGAGATNYRTKTVKCLLGIHSPSVIRGNGSEIKSLADENSNTKGVDSQISAIKAINAAHDLSLNHNCIVSISGKTDYIIKGERKIGIANGHSLMTKVTGLGCTASALTGAFLAINPSAFCAATHAMVIMGIAGEIAAEHARGPGSLQMNFLDALYGLTKEDIKNRIKLVNLI